MIKSTPKKKKWAKKTPTNYKFSKSKQKSTLKLDPNIEITKEFKYAFETIENTNNHIFLTGRAGTGKSTLLKYFRTITNKKHVILAPTGVAALNVKGQTIHSFFGFHPKIEKRLVKKATNENLSLFKQLDTIIIDEISMVRADLLDCIDQALRLNRGEPDLAFGGVQMVFIGDLFQLPPVVTRDDGHRFETEYTSPFFFSSDVMREVQIHLIELETIHRQKEKSFIELLNNVRSGEIQKTDIEKWNIQHDSTFDPTNEDSYIVHLTTTNKMAKERNDFELKKLSGKEHTLKAKSMGELGIRKMPSDSTIKLKEGARIMFTTNDPTRRWVNGSLGTVIKIQKQSLSKTPTLKIKLENQKIVDVTQFKWEIFEYQNNDGHFEEEVIGTYSQYPIALAWAVTIHKAQGKTFDKVLIDIGWGAFAHGQMYVALSRCTNFEGITLLKPFRAKDVIVDQAVLDFINQNKI